jgi:hypothetical protein
MPRREHEHELPALEEALSYSMDDTRQVTGWTEPQLYDELKTGRVKSYTLGRRRFIEAASLRARIAQLVNEAAPIRPEARFAGRNGRKDGSKNYLIAKK